MAMVAVDVSSLFLVTGRHSRLAVNVVGFL